MMNLQEKVRLLEFRVKKLETILMGTVSPDILEKAVGLDLSCTSAVAMYSIDVARPFTITDVFVAFDGYFSKDNIRMALMRLARDGRVTRIKVGLYAYNSGDPSGSEPSQQTVARRVYK